MGYYRFSNGVFVEADTFKEAQEKLIKEIKKEKSCRWHKCTCLGLSHRVGCYWENRDPETEEEFIPY